MDCMNTYHLSILSLHTSLRSAGLDWLILCGQLSVIRPKKVLNVTNRVVI